jgi:hypothetical protein
MMFSFNQRPISVQNEYDDPFASEQPMDMSYDDSPRCIGADVNAHSNFKFGPTEANDGNAINSSTIKEDEEESPAEVAAILTSISTIASREIKEDSSMMKELAELAFPDLSRTVTTEEDDPNVEYEYKMQADEPMQWQYDPAAMPFQHRHRYYVGEDKKTRAVSMDSPDLRVFEGPNSFEEEAVPTLLEWRTINPSHSFDHQDSGEGGNIFSTPPHSPASKRHNMMFGAAGPVPNSEYRRSNYNQDNVQVFKTNSIAENVKTKYNRPRSVSVAEQARQGKEERRRHASAGNAMDLQLLDNRHVGEDKPMQLILRKKFSWKNYPEVSTVVLVASYLINSSTNIYSNTFAYHQLEEFLIANREEYLRHSTLNYTMQQKKYNNILTQRLIELASTHGYQFDPRDFSFVTVRDRIRCYFKSYVQSMKKRGVVIGYAARKAGLVSEEELEISALTSGKIYVPFHDMSWEGEGL